MNPAVLQQGFSRNQVAS